MIYNKIKTEGPFTLYEIVDIAKSEFSKGDKAIGIYIEPMDSFIWLCSSKQVVAEIKKDSPLARTYTLVEIIQLLKNAPTPESQNAKARNFRNN